MPPAGIIFCQVSEVGEVFKYLIFILQIASVQSNDSIVTSTTSDSLEEERNNLYKMLDDKVR